MAPGWGITGNPPYSEGLIYNKYATNNTSYNGVQSMIPQNLRLTQIKWEKNSQWNVGVKLNLFDDLLQFDLNVYKKKTTDLLNNGIGIPTSTGYSSLATANVGSLENQGWELYVNTKPILKFGKFYVEFEDGLGVYVKLPTLVLQRTDVRGGQ